MPKEPLIFIPQGRGICLLLASTKAKQVLNYPWLHS